MKKFLSLYLILIVVSGCEKDPVLSNAPRGELVEVSLNGSLQATEVSERITELDPKDIVHYGVKFYRIVYRTQYQGRPIDSGGLIIVPDDIQIARLMVYCHGTEIPSRTLGSDKITPSLYKGSRDTHRDVRNMGLGWASAGYVVFLPDYPGFGITAHLDHPYIYFPELFKSIIDGLLATKSFIREQTDLAYDGNLFITGWSQGGGACMATHKYIQEQYPDEFRIVASSSLAGLSNVEWFLDQYVRRTAPSPLILPILSWGVYVMNKFSEMKRPSDQLYSYPVYDQMSSIIVPSLNPDRVFSPLFVKGVTTRSDTLVMKILKRNSYHEGWMPRGKVFLHHGDDDNLVPFEVSQTVLEGLTKEGGDVKLYRYEGGKHDSELGNFIRQTRLDFDLLP